MSKLKTKTQINPTNVQFMLSEICEEVGQTYHEPAWTQKEKKSVENWVAYCKEEDILPYQKLFDTCKFWDKLKTSMANTEGKTIILKDSVSFWEMFLFRREIGSKLAAHKDIWEADYGDDWNEEMESNGTFKYGD